MTKLSKDHERRVARKVGGRRIPLSGSHLEKGDVHTDTLFIECKTSRQRSGPSKSITIRKDALEKMLLQQQKEKKIYHGMVIHFVGDKQDWVIMSFSQFIKLIQSDVHT